MSGDGRKAALLQAVASAPLRLETERLLFRPFRPEDAPAVLHFASDYDIARMTMNIPHPYEEGMAEEWISRHKGERERGEGLTWAIELREDGTFLGAVGMRVEPEDEAAEIGYWIAKPYWGRGYASEAARSVITCGFESVGLHRIFARHFTGNPASGRVMQKAGMQYEGTLRHAHRRFGEWRDFAFYSILESEYRAA